MRYVGALACIGLMLAVTATAGATTTLVFDANDVFNYATTDNTTLNQQGTARRVDSPVTGRVYRTYNDGGRDPGPPVGTSAGDLTSVANIVGWTGATAGYQGVSFVQLWLRGGISYWGEKILVKSGTLTASMNGEYNWTADVDAFGTPTFNTVLGGPGFQEAISSFNPAEKLWSVTGDMYVDNNGNGVYDGTGEDLVLGNQYTIWFGAQTNNWPVTDAYGNDTWNAPFPYWQGTILATAVPEPVTMAGLMMGIGGLVTYVRKRRKA